MSLGIDGDLYRYASKIVKKRVAQVKEFPLLSFRSRLSSVYMGWPSLSKIIILKRSLFALRQCTIKPFSTCRLSTDKR